MKLKIFSLVAFILILVLWFTGCAEQQQQVETASFDLPLKECNTIYDEYDNIIFQTFYNALTDEYIMKEYTYIYDNGYFVCTDQKTIVTRPDKLNNKNSLTTTTIYLNSDLKDKPIIIMDNEYVKVTIKKYLEKANWWEFGYEVEVVNKTNQVISFMFDDVYIMDIKCKPLFTIDHIDAGKTTNFTLAWDSETLERCYIPYIDNIEFIISIYDNDNWKVPALDGAKIMFKN